MTASPENIPALISALENKVCCNVPVSREEALLLAEASGQGILDLCSAAGRIRNLFRGDCVDLCSITNAKSGACPEDCSYCAQSSRSTAEISIFPLADKAIVLERAREAKSGGVKRFCIVTSGRKVSMSEIRKISDMVREVRSIGLLPCATLGLLSKDELMVLKDAGLERFHHNIETSERFFPSICTTHTYQDKLGTIAAVKETGLSLCSGGLFGLGETWEDRIDMALALRDIDPDSVPVNFLTPIQGTKLGTRAALEPMEALKIISIYRFMLPGKEVRVCGGRIQTLGELHPFIFSAGADGLLTGNYLTTLGRSYEDDLRMIQHLGLKAG